MTTKEQITQATIDLTNELGLNGAATSKIARKAGIAIGTLFHHFPTKQELVETVFLGIYGDYVEWLSQKVNEHGVSLKKQLKMILRESIVYWLSKPEKFDFVYQVFYSKYYTESIETRTEALQSEIVSKIKNGVEQKILRTSEAELLSPMIFHSIMTNSRLVISAPSETLRTRYRKEGQRFLWNAIKFTDKPK